MSVRVIRIVRVGKNSGLVNVGLPRDRENVRSAVVVEVRDDHRADLTRGVDDRRREGGARSDVAKRSVRQHDQTGSRKRTAGAEDDLKIRVMVLAGDKQILLAGLVEVAEYHPALGMQVRRKVRPQRLRNPVPYLVKAVAVPAKQGRVGAIILVGLDDFHMAIAED